RPPLEGGDLDAALPNVVIAAASDANANAEAWRRWAEDFTYDLNASMGVVFSGRVGSGKVVKGAPYSAELVTETNQALADGNVITHRTSGRAYRDSEGRTRQETDVQGKQPRAFIDDPVAGTHIVLTPGTQSAIVLPRVARLPRAVDSVKQSVNIEGTEVRVEDGKVYVDGRERTDGKVVVKSKSGREMKVENGRIWIDGKEVGAGDGTGTHVGISREVVDGVPRQEVRVKVVRIGDDDFPPPPPIPPVSPVPPVPGMALPPVPPVPPLPPIPGLQTLRFESTADLGKGVTTKLGTKEFEGVKAEGTSTVWTIPAGKIGNRNPINVTKESWYSPELQVLVYSRHNDPRTGESVYRLASIKRAEPAADLFKVPEGYRTKSRERHGAAPEAKAPPPPR
ncbi:MAG: hypothetical protein ACXWBQ_11635, partial [Usitatibacter sp.]